MSSSISDTGLSFSDNAAQPQAWSLQTPTLNAGAMTLTPNPCTVTFRASSLTTGGNQTFAIPSPTATTIPSGATLGATNAVTARLAWGFALNGSTPVVIVGNVNGLPTDTSQFISPTTISAGATSAGVWYSASAVSANSPFVICGFVDSTQATAGTYATAPNIVQGDVAHLGAMQSVGWGQTWQNVTGSRALGTTYYNTTGKPITLAIQCSAVNTIQVAVNGVNFGFIGTGNNTYTYIVPPNGSYAVTGTSATFSFWNELR